MNNGRPSVLLIGPNDRNRLAVSRELSGPEVGVLRECDHYPNEKELSSLIEQNHDIVILELDSEPEYALSLVETFSSPLNGSTVIVYSAQPDQDSLLRSMRSGAREFLTCPLAHGEMADALQRTWARLSDTAKSGDLLVFLGAKGGVGVTLLASSFALSLAHESGKRCLLIDLDLPLGDIALNLGLIGTRSTVDALQNAPRLDPHFLSQLLRPYKDNLSVLAAPGEFSIKVEDEEAINKLISVARVAFDFVIVDAGSRLDIFKTNLYKKATTIYLVTQTGVPDLRNSNRLIGQIGPEGSKLRIIINRSNSSNQDFDDNAISKALTRAADWKVPNDYVTASRAQNSGTPLALLDTPISKVIRAMARSACGAVETPKPKPRFFGIFR